MMIHHFKWLFLAIGTFPMIRIYNDQPIQEGERCLGPNSARLGDLRIHPVKFACNNEVVLFRTCDLPNFTHDMRLMILHPSGYL